jgi:hypothetical protein
MIGTPSRDGASSTLVARRITALADDHPMGHYVEASLVARSPHWERSATNRLRTLAVNCSSRSTLLISERVEHHVAHGPDVPGCGPLDRVASR